MPRRTRSQHVTKPRAARRLAAITGVIAALAVLTLNPATASAHTGFDSSNPADGDTLQDVVDVITIVFTGEASPVGDGFTALTPDGVVQEPTSVETVDSKVFTVRFEPPLAGGQVGVRWHVQAADAHPIEGAFSFIVDAPPPAPAETSTTTVAPSTTTDDSTIAPGGATESVTGAGGADPESSPPAAETGVPAVATSAPAVGGEELGSAVPAQQSLDDFLTVDSSTPGETTATVGRLVGLLGVVLGLGAFAFVATALRGRRAEIRRALAAVRVLGVVIAVGAAIEYVGVARIGGQSLTAGWTTSAGVATVLRVVGGLGLAIGIAGSISSSRVQRQMRRPSVVRSLSAAVADDLTGRTPRIYDDDPIVRWTPNKQSWPAIAGSALVIGSFWFDGHTVSKGFRPLHALVNSVHVVAGSVWVGGVVMMAAVIWARYRAHRPMRVVELVVRFSKIATIALAAVIGAGALMAMLVLDSPGELTSTPWGKILLLKSAAVGLAMIGGAYNHFRLLPALEADPESPELLTELRSTVTAEAIMLVFVVAVTAWLVAAAS